MHSRRLILFSAFFHPGTYHRVNARGICMKNVDYLVRFDSLALQKQIC